jgi:hypothetical protein
LCALGIFAFIRPSRPMRREQFDMFGFATLSLGVGSLQLMLDHSEVDGKRPQCAPISDFPSMRDALGSGQTVGVAGDHNPLTEVSRPNGG